MKLQIRLRSECSGSITMAAQKLYITQPSLFKAVSELEQEMGITIFLHSNRGVILSEEGTKFFSYARQVVEQAELLEQTYKYGEPIKRVFAIWPQQRLHHFFGHSHQIPERYGYCVYSSQK